MEMRGERLTGFSGEGYTGSRGSVMAEQQEQGERQQQNAPRIDPEVLKYYQEYNAGRQREEQLPETAQTLDILTRLKRAKIDPTSSLAQRLYEEDQLMSRKREAFLRRLGISPGPSDERLREMFPGLSSESAREYYTLDRWFNHIAERGEVPKQEMPGVALREEGKDWYEQDWSRIQVNGREIRTGWTNEMINKIGEALQKRFHWDKRIDKAQIVTTIEQLFATTLKAEGDEPRTPEELLMILTDDALYKRIRSTAEKEYGRGNRGRDIADIVNVYTKYNMLKELNLDEQVIRRFILFNEFRDTLDSEHNSLPANAEDMGWQIMYAEKLNGARGFGGSNPILEMRMVWNESEKKFEARYFLNKANVIHWQMSKILWWVAQSPKEIIDFHQQVKIQKSWRDLSLLDLVAYEDRFFSSEYGGEYYKDLVQMMQIISGAPTVLRKCDLEYQQRQGNAQEQINAIKENFYTEFMTRSMYGKPFKFWLCSLPHRFEGFDSDSRLGSAFNDFEMCFFYLSDVNQLREILGRDSSFFTAQGMYQAMIEAYFLEKGRWNEGTSTPTLLGPDETILFSKAFGIPLYQMGTPESMSQILERTGGRIVDEKSFSKMINFMRTGSPNTPLEAMVRRALKNAIAEKHDIFMPQKEGDRGKKRRVDEESISYAELMAYATSTWNLARARNNIETHGFESLTPLALTAMSRFNAVKKMQKTGIPETMYQYISLGRSWLEFTKVADKKKIYDDDGNLVEVRSKSTIEVQKELVQLGKEHHIKRKKLSEDLEQGRISQEKYDATIKALNREYKDVAQQFEYGSGAMRTYADLYLQSIYNFYDNMIKAGEFNFGEFTERRMTGLYWKRDAFQEQFLDKIAGPLRSALVSFVDINWDLMVPKMVFNENGEPMWTEEVPLAEATFGREILNIPEFWKRDKRGNPIPDERTGGYKIDYNLINSPRGKTVLFKSVLSTELAAGLRAHFDHISNDPLFDLPYFVAVMDTIEELPGKYLGTEFGMKNTVKGERLFSRAERKRLFQRADITMHKLYRRALIGELFMPKSGERGFKDMFAAFFRAILPG